MKRIIVYFFFSFVSHFCWAENRSIVFKLTQELINEKKGTFLIDRNFDLDGGTVVIPQGLVVKFHRGKIDNGTIVGSKTKLEIDKKACVFGKDILIQGSWSVKEIYDKWFEFDDDKNFISNKLINNILSLSNDDMFCQIFFNEDRVYYFKLQTQIAPNIGNSLSFDVKSSNNKKVRRYHYEEVFGDKYSDNRIFTIPSNTRVTINNKFQMLPTNHGIYFVFWECGKKNITIDGNGSISGDCSVHLYTDPFFKKTHYYGEWGYIFRCFNCENFIIKDIELSDAFGDLLGYGCYPVEDERVERGSKDLVVDNVKFVRARRNGVAVSAKNVIIRRCLFQDCGIDEIRGTAPRAAIDFENDYILKYPETGNENVVMENCVFINNKHDVSATYVNVPTYGKTAVIIKNCHFFSPIRLNTTPHWIRFENCIIPSFTNWQNKIDSSTPIRYLEFVNCHIKTIPQLLTNKKWNNRFENCVIDTIK